MSATPARRPLAAIDRAAGLRRQRVRLDDRTASTPSTPPTSIRASPRVMRAANPKQSSATGLARGGAARRVAIATEAGIETGPDRKGLSRAYILRAVEDSLGRLRTDHIDLDRAGRKRACHKRHHARAA